MVEITIDLDNKGVPYNSGIVEIIFSLLPYKECDVIDRKTQYPVVNSKLKCLESKILGVKIENNRIFDNVNYVYVFFSTMNNKVPLVFGVSTGTEDKVVYYTGFAKRHGTHQLSSLKKVSKENLLDVVIGESDRVNNTLTYLLDKRTSYNNIKVTAMEKHQASDPEIFKHTPDKIEKSAHLLILSNYKKSITEPDVSSFLIPEMRVHWYQIDQGPEKLIPLAFDYTMNELYYFYTRDKNNGSKWTNFLNNRHNILKTTTGEQTEMNNIEKKLPEKIEDQKPYGFNALFLGLIFYILFTIGFCLPPLYKIYRHAMKKYIGKRSTY
ncbi:conserved hypothetical protein [Theileria orientalis strain Shintoku]|uniref:Uncharacterized protein n=1 Tax=Theileria orientalis strain Shintoku TaxID=869250 RepID=J4C3L7_THEOR|nr:conserved hypothetical protein [Theileria orientalis strain Shintoku]PVC54485.1 hypothetical protein MACL_00003067 [Theileria orientalis]BAM40661.1 conserved hypothetical protein [Theileria orientalis strain Shintoku]|eukprot:XP_009690962.1 conserved hypothetical protein [Theileria orientalis strain Shintoku]